MSKLSDFDELVLQHVDEVLQAEEDVSLTVLRNNLNDMFIYACDQRFQLILLQECLPPILALLLALDRVAGVYDRRHVLNFTCVGDLIVLSAGY